MFVFIASSGVCNGGVYNLLMAENRHRICLKYYYCGWLVSLLWRNLGIFIGYILAKWRIGVSDVSVCLGVAIYVVL